VLRLSEADRLICKGNGAPSSLVNKLCNFALCSETDVCKELTDERTVVIVSTSVDVGYPQDRVSKRSLDASHDGGAGTAHTFKVNMRRPIACNMRRGSFATTM